MLPGVQSFPASSNGLQQSWITPDYGLFSEAFQNNPRILGQTYPFGVRWIQPGAADYTLFWFSIPLLDRLEVPGRIRGTIRTVLIRGGNTLFSTKEPF